MIPHLDNMIRALLMRDVEALRPPPPPVPPVVTEQQVRFQPPDAVWRAHVDSLGTSLALNVYLVDLRENRKLRSNERVRQFQNGVVENEPAPARLDCHYLISAWNPAAPSATVEPTLDEHLVLYEVSAVLKQSAPLNASNIFPPGSAALNAIPEIIRTADLPTEVLPTEGFPKLPEFWGAMGTGALWKPVVYLIVTLPIELIREIAGPMVTTRITEYRQAGIDGTTDVLYKIGGHVLDATVNPPLPLAGAWVQIETAVGDPIRNTTTDARGRFTFDRLQAGNYQLRWRAGARPEPAPRAIQVPSPTGEYDLRFV